MVRRISKSEINLFKTWLGERSVVLIGLMGAGKTSIGRRLAKRMELPFIDADAEIENAAGKTIAEIFADHGEEGFRDGERRVIARLLDSGPQILATGGGAYIDDATRKKISQTGVSLWLRADFNLLMKRVKRRSTRPLLQNPDPEGTMRRLIDERYPLYELADLVIDSRDVTHNAMVNLALAGLIDHAEIKPPAKKVQND